MYPHLAYHRRPGSETMQRSGRYRDRPWLGRVSLRLLYSRLGSFVRPHWCCEGRSACAQRILPSHAPLAVLCLGQLMCILDISIVNIAIPLDRAKLALAPSTLQWVVTAYVLAYGGLLLVGGRLADYFYGGRCSSSAWPVSRYLPLQEAWRPMRRCCLRHGRTGGGRCDHHADGHVVRGRAVP